MAIQGLLTGSQGYDWLLELAFLLRLGDIISADCRQSQKTIVSFDTIYKSGRCMEKYHPYDQRAKIWHDILARQSSAGGSGGTPNPSGKDPLPLPGDPKRLGFIALATILTLLACAAWVHGADIQGSILDRRSYEPSDGYKFRLGQSSQEESWTNQPTALCCRTRQCLVAQEEGLPIDPIGLAREVLYFTMPRDNGDMTLSVREPLHIGRNEVTFLGGTFITTETLPYSAFGQKTDSLTYWWDSSSSWVPRVAFPRIDFDYPATSRAAFVPEVCRLGISLQWELP